ncbi:MAG: sigma-70 family RNA polymerase sigma factor [Acidobacteriaceae bacterium]|nr:sigma-70 family RNA polymerase sigma factor [Acidobacteriaceae bacterium]
MSSSRSCQSLAFSSARIPSPDGRTPGAKLPDHPNAPGADELGILFEQYSRSVLGAACRVLHDHSEAEEVVQDVFLYVHRKSQLFDPSRGSLKAWIIQIALTRALDRKLYLARKHFHADRHITCHQLHSQTDLERQIDAKLTRARLETALSVLTDRQRRTIEFFYFEGLDLREISEQLGEPLGSIRHHLYRGLARLRRCSLLHPLRL